MAVAYILAGVLFEFFGDKHPDKSEFRFYTNSNTEETSVRAIMVFRYAPSGIIFTRKMPSANPAKIAGTRVKSKRRVWAVMFFQSMI